MSDFYDQIEEQVRPVVRMLRDNGVNTTSSCHHDMTIEIELGSHLDEVEKIGQLLVEAGYNTFKIDVILRVPKNAFWSRRCTIKLGEWM